MRVARQGRDSEGRACAVTTSHGSPPNHPNICKINAIYNSNTTQLTTQHVYLAFSTLTFAQKEELNTILSYKVAEEKLFYIFCQLLINMLEIKQIKFTVN